MGGKEHSPIFLSIIFLSASHHQALTDIPMLNFTKQTKLIQVTGFTASTAAASTAWSDKIDLANWTGVRFISSYRSTAASTGTATFAIYATDTSTADSTSYAAIALATQTIPKSTTAKSQRYAAIDVQGKLMRYVKARITRKRYLGINSVIAELYGPRSLPVTHSSTTAALATAAASNTLVVCQSTST
jgi:hypothetical protein